MSMKGRKVFSFFLKNLASHIFIQLGSKGGVLSWDKTWLYTTYKWWHPLIYIRRTYNMASEFIRLKCKLSSFQKLLIVSINQFDITLKINIHWFFLFWIFLYKHTANTRRMITHIQQFILSQYLLTCFTPN